MISDIHTLDTLEQCHALHPLHSALETLRLARPGETIDTLAGLTIAGRDRDCCTCVAPCSGRSLTQSCRVKNAAKYLIWNLNLALLQTDQAKWRLFAKATAMSRRRGCPTPLIC